MTASMRPGTQTARLVDWLRHNPGSSSLDITFALKLVNVTGRVSDARAAGIRIDCREDEVGVARYYIVEPKPVDDGIQEPLWRVAS